MARSSGWRGFRLLLGQPLNDELGEHGDGVPARQALAGDGSNPLIGFGPDKLIGGEVVLDAGQRRRRRAARPLAHHAAADSEGDALLRVPSLSAAAWCA